MLLLIYFQKRFVFLTSEFEPTGADGAIPLPANTGYHFNSLGVAFESDERKLFNFRFESNYGQFFNGKSFSTAGRFLRPFQTFSWCITTIILLTLLCQEVDP